MSEGAWLSEEQQRLWRAWLALNAQLPAALNRQLQTSGLSLQDFDVLVQLTEAEDSRIRISDLARALTWDRSRVSHHVRRMQGRDLVRREECPDDGRGAFAVLTPTGRAAIERAAPSHVQLVQELVFAALSSAELATLQQWSDVVLTRLQALEASTV